MEVAEAIFRLRSEGKITLQNNDAQRLVLYLFVNTKEIEVIVNKSEYTTEVKLINKPINITK